MKVSVLVPIYGVEKYIGQCAKTLFAQTYNNIEYVFVDDCTPDNSIEVLQQVLVQYPQRKNQVRIIRHEHNRGLGAARKTAFEAATGDFVVNVDSDDYLALDGLEKLVKNQQQTGADIVSSAYCSHYEDGQIVRRSEPNISRAASLKLMLIQNTLLPHIWARLIRRTLYIEHGISSLEGINMAEDMALTPRLIHAARSISYIDDVTYYYRDDSLASTFTNHLSEKHVESYLKANQVLWQYFRNNDESREFLTAFQIGMLNAYYHALAGNFTIQQIKTLLSYEPQSFAFRCLHTILARKQTLSLLRFAYLSIKWGYKKYFLP
jgi:glycosyltransferase involved in cell wall biosynthesis